MPITRTDHAEFADPVSNTAKTVATPPRRFVDERVPMTRSGSVPLWLCTLLLATTGLTAQQAPLRIVSVGPDGPLDSLAQANEIRVVFSEPMVTLGRIPAEVQAPFVRISPEVRGSFRWSGTTILIFTPDRGTPLPYATTYEVTVDTTATAVSGRRLSTPRTFTFTTPTVRLLST